MDTSSGADTNTGEKTSTDNWLTDGQLQMPRAEVLSFYEGSRNRATRCRSIQQSSYQTHGLCQYPCTVQRLSFGQLDSNYWLADGN